MPRLTNKDYLSIRNELRRCWLDYYQGFAEISPLEQITLHAYFGPSVEATDHEALAVRKLVTEQMPSLPHKAGRAWRNFRRAKSAWASAHYQVVDPNEKSPRKVPKQVRDISARAVMRPGPDIPRLARILVGMVAEK